MRRFATPSLAMHIMITPGTTTTTIIPRRPLRMRMITAITTATTITRQDMITTTGRTTSRCC